MPGIVGLITRMPPELAEAQLSRMLGTLRHERFYVSGAWIDKALGTYIGWTARKNSFGDKMPVQNDSGAVVIVFSGDDHPGPDGARRTASRDREEAGPTYLVPLYEENPDFLRTLNGRFHGLVADRRRGTVTLFNDRFGLHRIYYHEAREGFYFSAEAKAILAVRPELRRIDATGLADFVACGCVLENRTLFSGISALPPGSAWSFRGGGIHTKRAYFDPREWEEQEPLDSDGYYRELRDAFACALPRYFQGHENVGISLTGGLDTRLIMAWQRRDPGSLPCYTFGSMYRENQDVRLARRVAALCDQPYHLVEVDAKCVLDFPRQAERTLYLTDGGVDVSRSLDLYNNQVARQIAPARMVGTFGSEIIRSAVMFKPVTPQRPVFQNEVMNEIARASRTYWDDRKRNGTSFVAFRQPSLYHFGGLMLEESQLTLRTPLLDNDVVRTAFRAPRIESGEDVRLRLVRDGKPELARLRTDRGLGDRNGILSFLQKRYLEFTFKAEYAYDIGMPQWVAAVDHAFAPLHLERLWLGRHKPFHYRYWYRTSLARYIKDILLDPRALARPYVKRHMLETVVQDHVNGKRNFTHEIHRLLSLELLHRIFVDDFYAPEYN